MHDGEQGERTGPRVRLAGRWIWLARMSLTVRRPTTNWLLLLLLLLVRVRIPSANVKVVAIGIHSSGAIEQSV